MRVLSRSCRTIRDACQRELGNIQVITNLRNGIGRYEAENVCLNTLVQLDRCLQLASMERATGLWLNMAFGAHLIFRGDLGHVRDELVPQAMIDVQLA